jgi:hypothetical protein
MDYTPRQIQAFRIIGEQRRRGELSLQLMVNMLAARADEKAIREQLRDWDE